MTVCNATSAVSKLGPSAPRGHSQTQLVAVREESIEEMFADLAYLFDAQPSQAPVPAPVVAPAPVVDAASAGHVTSATDDDDEPPEEPTVVHLDPQLVAATARAQAVGTVRPTPMPAVPGMRTLKSAARPAACTAAAVILDDAPRSEPPVPSSPELVLSPELVPSPALAAVPALAAAPAPAPSRSEPPPASVPVRARRRYSRAVGVILGACLLATLPVLVARAMGRSSAATDGASPAAAMLHDPPPAPAPEASR